MTFNGTEQSLTGVTFVAKNGDQTLDNGYFNVTYNSNVIVSGTNVGTYTQNFDLSSVSISSTKYPNITIVSGDGSNITLQLTIESLPITIKAGNSFKQYDGRPLTSSTFTVTGKPRTDTHTFVVTMTSNSTITNVGTQPNVIATVDGVAVETGVEKAIGNYLVTTVDGTLTVSQKIIYSYSVNYGTIQNVPAGVSFPFPQAPNPQLQPNTSYNLSVTINGIPQGDINSALVTTDDSGTLSQYINPSWKVRLQTTPIYLSVESKNDSAGIRGIGIEVYSREGVV